MFCSSGLKSPDIMDLDTASDSTDDIYEVEKIIDFKRKDGKVWFKVRWEGYGPEEDSWEPSDNLLTCQELVDRYWLERKEGYKKRGRKPKRLKEMAEEDSDTDDSNEKDQNDEDAEMITPPEKRRRGRPSKKDNGQMDSSSSTSPDLSEGNTAKKKRGRPPKDSEYYSHSLASSELLLLDLDEIAPLGLTRQASKELALVSLRKKQEHDPITDSSSEFRSPFVEASSDTKQVNSETSAVRSKRDNFEVIEISSQGTTDEEREDCLQDSRRPVIKECIVISSQSESEEEPEKVPVNYSQDSTKTKLKKKNKKDKPAMQGAGKDCIGKDVNSVVKKKKLKKSLSASKTFEHSSDVDNYPPIDFSVESRAGVSLDDNDRQPLLKSSKNLEGFEIEASKGFNESGQDTDENSNQLSTSLTRADMSSKLSMSKMETLRKTMKVKNPIVGLLDNDNKTEQKRAYYMSNGTDNSATTQNSSSKLSPVSFEQRLLGENGVLWHENNEMEKSATRTSIDQDTSQLTNQSSGAMRRLGDYKKHKGKARRTQGRPKSIREFKKRLSIEKTPVTTYQNSSNAEYSTGVMKDAQGKMDKYNVTSTAAELLPMQNRTNSVPLMDGDLIGAIIQQSGNDSEIKSPSTATAAKKDDKNEESDKGQDKTQDDAGNFRSWDSGMEDISDGEDDLSDFEFDLDDYSPHSFFNEESTVPDRASSPAVDPLYLSWAALRQAIQEGDVTLVRRALAVPGFNPDDVAIDTASGMSLLMWAATSGQDEIVRLLLRRGAGVNTVQKITNMTALMHAAEQGFPETVQILLESGAHINWQQTAGETALMKACKKGHEEVVEVLLKHGVDTKAQSSYEQTAIQIALRNQHFGIQNLLQEHEKSLENTLQVALGKCLGTAGTLRLPLVMPYRCTAPGEKESVTFTLKYNPSKGPQGTKVVLFCVKAEFSGDELCLSFHGDNGVRSVLLNSSIQYPLVQGNRSVYLLNLDAESSSNELTVETHPAKSRLIVCAANVSPSADSI